MVVMDAGTLLLLFHPHVEGPIDQNTGKPVDLVKERISYLIKTLEKAKTKIVIPTPALSEILVRAGEAGTALLQQISKASVFRIEPFDILAAIEVARMTKGAIDAGDKRGGLLGTWAKVKYDRQIVATACVVQATAIYSDDGDIGTLGKALNINVIGIAQLPLPPTEAQGKLALDAPERSADAQTDEITDEEFEKLVAQAQKSNDDDTAVP